jgi:glutamate-1-semialdehyde 2,1-aminomutase
VQTGARLQAGLEEATLRRGIPFTVHRQGSMLGIFFTAEPIRRMDDVTASDRARFSRVFHRLLAAGIHLPPSPYEAMFLSTAHGAAEIAATVEAFDRALAAEGE